MNIFKRLQFYSKQSKAKESKRKQKKAKESKAKERKANEIKGKEMKSNQNFAMQKRYPINSIFFFFFRLHVKRIHLMTILYHTVVLLYKTILPLLRLEYSICYCYTTSV
jgi:hypothetical protein